MTLSYKEFLESKTLNDIPSGFEPRAINDMLFDFQADIVKWAIKRGRAAVFADCGLGKTPMQLDWAKHVYDQIGRDILIVAPLAVSRQTKREGKKFGVQVNVCREQKDVIPGINITNYEMLHKFDADQFGGVVLDESSILKSYTGKIRSMIIEMFQETPYKLACTATPAPNDFMELGNHSQFLNVMTREEMLSMFFINDAGDTGTWRLKGHAEDEFWKWLCSWAVMVKKPSDLDYENDGFTLPALNLIEKVIPHGGDNGEYLFAWEAKTLSERREARRNSLNERVKAAADLVNSSDEGWLIWCDLNRESEELKRAIPGSVEVKGADTLDHKEKSILNFANGDSQILVTKPKIAGFGLNLQVCHNVIFVGLSDSYEAFYQAIRRVWRFGQEHPVNAYIITGELEGAVVSNIKRKESDVERMALNMVKHMADFSKQEIRGQSKQKVEYQTNHDSGENWEMSLGDSVELIKKVESDSIHYSLFSPPFASLFTYSDSERDMGNCKNLAEFIEHFKFMTDELYRITMPGRLLSSHCMNLPATITHDGYIGIKDFRGDLIRLFESSGFIFHSEVVIWKDPLIQATRTKVLMLAHKQISKDASRCAQGLPDYIITFRKQGENPEPVSKGRGFEDYIGGMDDPKDHKTDNARTNKYSHKVWQRYASPVWFDIRQTHTLNERIARVNKDEKHMCPLQLDTIQRCVELWTNPGDMIFSPFAGIGSEGYGALKMGRRFKGFELKESYFNEAILNLKTAETEFNSGKLF